MDQYNYPNIIQIKELNNEESVNQYLELGWVLLNVLTVDRGEPRAVSQYVKYILGWNKDSGQIKTPEDPSAKYNFPF